MKKHIKRKAQKPRAIQTSRLWHLTHRTHSGRIIESRHTSYPILVMLVMCVGVFLAGWTHMVQAQSESYEISARVPGVPPAQAAVIQTPADNAKFKNKPITVAGTCPLDTYVQLFRNNIPSGVSLCGPDGKFTIETDLFDGENFLLARVYNLADVPGPDSTQIKVFYAQDRAVPAAETTSKHTEPLILKSDFKYQGYNTGESVTWRLDLRGGVPPYAVNVDWGDGKQSLYNQPAEGLLTIEHTYDKSGGYKGSYIIKIAAIDSVGTISHLQLITIINNPAAIAGLTKKGVSNINGSLQYFDSDQFAAMVKYVWPSYIVVVLMLASFWLGERREHGITKAYPHKSRLKHKY